jgi:hypothetical protein
MKAVHRLFEYRMVLMLAVAAAGNAIWLTAWIIHHPVLLGMDFAAYWRAAHQTAIEAYAPGQSVQFPYLPTMLMWISPLALVPFWPAYLLFMAASVSAFALASRPYLSRPQILLAIASPPIINGMSVGQCSVALAAALLWACGTRNRIAAGIVLGLIASIKPQLVLMAPALLLVRRDWQAFWAAGLTWAATILGTLAIRGVGAWQAWLGYLPYYHSVLMRHERLGMATAPSFAAQYLHLPPMPFAVAGIILGSWLIWTARRSPPLVQCAVIACASLLSAPYAMVYDLAPIIPFLTVEIWAASFAAALAMSGGIAPISLLLAGWRIHDVARDPPRSEDDRMVGLATA